MDVWQPGPGREIILNLPCTVERSTPNVYADQIEWMSRNLSAARARLPVGAHPQRPRHRGRRRRAGRAGRRGPGGGLPVRQRRADRQRLPGHPGHEPVQPGHRPDDRLLRHRRDPAHRRVLQPAAGAPARTRTRATWSTPRSPARTRTRSRRASRPWRPTPRPPARTSRDFAWAVPYLAIDPQRRRPHLRGRDPGQLPVRQGRRGLHHEGRAPAGPAAAAADRVLPGGPGAHRRRGRRGHPGADVGGVLRPSTCPRAAVTLQAHHTSSVVDAKDALTAEISVDGQARQIEGTGNGPISAFCDALGSLGIEVRVLDYAEHALSAGSDAQAAAYVECEVGGRRLVGRRRRHQHGDRLAAGRAVGGQPRPGDGRASASAT